MGHAGGPHARLPHGMRSITDKLSRRTIKLVTKNALGFTGSGGVSWSLCRIIGVSDTCRLALLPRRSKQNRIIASLLSQRFFKTCFRAPECQQAIFILVVVVGNSSLLFHIAQQHSRFSELVIHLAQLLVRRCARRILSRVRRRVHFCACKPPPTAGMRK